VSGPTQAVQPERRLIQWVFGRFKGIVRTGLLPVVAFAILASGCAARPVRTLTWPATTSVFALPYRFTDEHGTPVTFAAWRGQPLILTMFFRSCQTRCPLTVSKMQELAAKLAERQVRANFVLVTLDPRNDTSVRLAEFKAAHGFPEDSWHLLRGERRETQALSHLLGMHSAYDEGHIDHDVRVVVFDAAGQRVHEYAGWHFDADVLLK
jgi:protein SCO1